MAYLERKYNMSNANLAQLTSDFVVFMTRDATEFAARAVDSAAITAFEALGNAFEVFPTDEEYQGLVQEQVDIKNNLKILLISHIQKVSGYVEQQYGLKSGQYKRLGITRLQIQSDRSFLVKCRQVVRVATEYLTALTPLGLTQAMIDAIEDNAQLFEDALNEIADKSALREAKSLERTQKGNELYGFLTTYSRIGKLIWENVNDAYYDNYVIYRRAPGTPGKVDNLMYLVPSNTADWSIEPLADTYELQFKLDDPAGVWAIAYEGTATSTIHNPGTGNWLYRCRAINAKGAGTWSDELPVIINPV